MSSYLDFAPGGVLANDADFLIDNFGIWKKEM
jgi:hypothetical protein